MTAVGENVVLSKTLMVGVVVAKTEKEHFFKVLAFDTDSKKYVNVIEHRLNMETMTLPEFAQHINYQNKELREQMYDVLADAALDAGDKKWFHEIAEARKGYHRPAEESEQEKNRVKPGQMVVDNNGRNSGIVLRKLDDKPGKFLISTFDTASRKYVEIERMASQLKVLKVPAWNREVNYSFKETREDIRMVCSELAAITEDYEWLEELNEKTKQESDGA